MKNCPACHYEYDSEECPECGWPRTAKPYATLNVSPDASLETVSALGRMMKALSESVECGNCGTWRTVENGIVQKCSYCGDDEIDLSDEINVP